MTEIDPSGLSRSTIEKRVEQIWRDVLHMPQERSDATFFELQGQSISAVRIVTRIEDELGVVVDVGLLFEDPDLATFTAAVAAAVPARDAQPASPA
ncbi:phosphopantetheine-binding protein [Micromonospora deserti]|uniref:Phosphopantetheine-binding protein n=1 Tax=Micromonospora deserti TaxID=2070366 RepID=A0A2W2DLF4_9ACTN|nr:phosphopantetheine-binding protein [Micromonospora deserti]PZF93703.1 phosphopantetheine-binding protein [Micromonospora deserti]